jgi:2-C-methyl-D-erythritol 4-phosphate cytidylyltransferase
MTTAVIIAAAGRGERLGAGTPKALVRIAGVTLLEHAVAVMETAGVDHVVVTAPPDQVGEFAALVPAATVVPGGATRQESVRLALPALPDVVDVVLVHDAARALVPVAMVQRVLAAVVAGAEAVVPVLPLADTVKEVGAGEVVVRTVDRSSLRAVQTPQGFRRQVLERAHASGRHDATDDAALAEAIGVTVTTVEGSAEALKVTTSFDLAVAEAVLALRGNVGGSHVRP